MQVLLLMELQSQRRQEMREESCSTKSLMRTISLLTGSLSKQSRASKMSMTQTQMRRNSMSPSCPELLLSSMPLISFTFFYSEVLSVQKKEEEYKIHEDDVDEFVVFRYELSNILRKHLNDDEKTSSIFGGRHPLSKVGGRQLKEILN